MKLVKVLNKLQNVLLLFVCLLTVVGVVYYNKHRDKFTTSSGELEYNQCMTACKDEKFTTGEKERMFTDETCETSCTPYKEFDDDCYKLDADESNETFTNQAACQDVSHSKCLEKCLKDRVPFNCLGHCEKWALQHNKKLETCFFRPGGLTPGDCKTRCEDYYSLFDDSICSKTCETVCNSCETSNCKWTNFQSEEEFPYQLSLFGVPSNEKVTISWEKPPYVVQKYIIMYFEEEKQHETGVKFIEKYGSACDNGEYCSQKISGLTNDKNYIIGVSAIFQNGSMTRMSNRLVMRPEDIPDNNEEEEEDNTTNNTTQNTTVQTQTPTRILAGALLREKRKANSQKILTDFNKSQSEHISDLFSYLATNPINLQFKLS